MKAVVRDQNKGYIDTWLWVPRSLINVTATQSALSFLFTDSYSGEQRVLYLWREAPGHLLVPRAFWDPGALPCEVVDCRPLTYPQILFKSRIKLDHRPSIINGQNVMAPTGENVQHVSIQKLLDSMGGVLQLACGRGKTIIALHKIALSQAPALIVVDNTNLLEQWLGDIEEFLEVPGGVGVLKAGSFDWKKAVVVATYQTLASKAEEVGEDFRRWFKHVFFDEAHHVNAPTYSKSVDMFYGMRVALTATPRRDDGLHIISDYHIGTVIHQDLTQPMTARIVFKWTGFELDLADPVVQAAVLDVNGEVHMSMVPGFLGSWRDRLWHMMQDAIDAVQIGRKVLVLSNSVDEVVNLMTLWTRGPHAPLYSDIPVPAPAEVGEQGVPLELNIPRSKELMLRIERHWGYVASGAFVNDRLESQINDAMNQWSAFLVHRKITNLLTRRQKTFIKDLVAERSTAGFMTFGVPPKVRQKFLDDRDVVFAITKYGKEGLDCPALDTVLVSSLFSSKNALQQLMGRPTRVTPGKVKKPIVVFYVDDIGPCIGMSKKLMKHLREWPHEEGGPFAFELSNYPRMSECKKTKLKDVFGQ